MEIVEICDEVRQPVPEVIDDHITRYILRRGYRGAIKAAKVALTRLQENLAKLMTFFVRLS